MIRIIASKLIPKRQIAFKNKYIFMGISSSSNVDMNSATAEYVKTTINGNPVVIFSKTTCPFCTMAKDAFKDIGVAYEAIELNKMKNGSEIQDILNEMTGARSVPRVFVHGNCIGGGSETKSLHQQGKLLPLVQQSK
ncbi:uncharacterized protein LOC141913279 [Tubulanus polymorphus]|uniref:uncharacterized protein LOC141913279 n=1 Tax=Tubulanus polymorphus TaxID=672921 RepID=UPI003DA29AA3